MSLPRAYAGLYTPVNKEIQVVYYCERSEQGVLRPVLYIAVGKAHPTHYSLLTVNC